MAAQSKKSVTLVTVLMLAFYGNWAWGVYRSFHRHGVLHGFVAIGFPPYAWYRGVAAIWEQPLWRENYSEEVTNITRIALAERPKDAARIVELSEAVSGRRKYVQSLPANVYDELRISCVGLLDAFPALQLRNTCLAFGHTVLLEEANDLLRDAEARISKTPQMLGVWEEYKDAEKNYLQMVFLRKDVGKLLEDHDQALAVVQAISIRTEASWDQLRKSCLGMAVVQESEIKPYSRDLWSSLLRDFEPTASASKSSSF